MIGNLVPYLNKIRRSNQSNDLVDRLNYQYTALLVAVGAVTLAATQYVGKPIQCWVPAQFTGAWEKYAETLCFIKGSYFLPDDANPDEYYMSEDKREIGYYQWVPIVLAFQAFLFYLPCLVWQAFNTSSGINVKEVLESSAKIKKTLKTEDRGVMVGKAAAHIKDALELQRDLKKNASLIGRIRKSGYFLTVLYLFSKLLFVCNIFVQFIIFNQFLGTDNTWWGWDIFTSLVAGQSWKETGHFPRVTLCDFNVRVLGAIHRWSVQCVLMINMYTEKIYVFLWFWFILIGFITIISLVYWFMSLVIPSNQREFVEKYLRCTNCIGSSPSRNEKNQVDSFVKNFLTADGVFLLRLIQTNGGDLMVGDICQAMYKKWCSRKETSVDDSFESPDTTATLPR